MNATSNLSGQPVNLSSAGRSEYLRCLALQNENTAKFIDAITLGVMKDPVITADNMTYERSAIEEWFSAQRASGGVFTSPLTNETLTNTELRPNTELKRQIDTFRAANESSINVQDIKFMLSSEIYHDLDKISSSNLLKSLNLRPPQIIVVGNESSGKSTLLERIIGLPIFPRDKGICTRCPIRVHLRRVTEKASIAKVSIVDKNPTVVDQRRENRKQYGRTDTEMQADRLLRRQFATPVPKASKVSIVALDKMRETIRAKMDALVAEQPNKMILEDKEIVVEIQLPYCLNLDIVDLPGLVTTNPSYQIKQDLPSATKNLAKRIIQEEKEFSIFLLVNDIKLPSNQSLGCELIEECNVKEKTIGIFTKLDTFRSEDGDDIEDMRKMIHGELSSSFPVNYGWIGTSSRPVNTTPSREIIAGPTQLIALEATNQYEANLESTQFVALRGIFGIHCVRQKVQTIYEQFITDQWIPHIKDHLLIEFEKLHVKNNALGVPLADCDSYRDLVHFIGVLGNFVVEWKECATTMTQLDTFRCKQFIQSRMQRMITSAEELWLATNKDDILWDAIKDYHKFIHPERKSPDEAVQQIQWHNQSQNHPQLTPPYYHYSHIIDSQHQLQSDHHQRPSYTRGLRHQKYFDSSLSLYQNSYDLPRPQQSNAHNVPMSSLNPKDPKQWVVESNIVEDAVQNKVKKLHKYLQTVFDRLIILLNENLFMDCILDDTKFADTAFPLLLRRFPLLQAMLKATVKERFQKCVDEFTRWYVNECIEKVISPALKDEVNFSTSPLVIKEYFRADNKSYCALHWGNTIMIEQFPHILLHQFHRCVRNTLKELEATILTLPITKSMIETEACSAERLDLLQSIKLNLEVYQSLIAFECRVHPGKKTTITRKVPSGTTVTHKVTTVSLASYGFGDPYYDVRYHS